MSALASCMASQALLRLPKYGVPACMVEIYMGQDRKPATRRNGRKVSRAMHRVKNEQASKRALVQRTGRNVCFGYLWRCLP